MRSYRLKVILLSLGVVLGYGSALSHGFYGRGHGWHGPGRCYEHRDHGEPRPEPPKAGQGTPGS